MRKLLSITLAVCIVLSCVYTGAIFAADTTYSWELLRATGFETAEGNPSGTTWNNMNRGSYNYEVYASDNLVFANTRAGSINHLISTLDGEKVLEVRNIPYIGDVVWNYPAIHIWDKNAGTTNNDASTLFGEVSGRVRVSFDIVAYGLEGENKVILGFDCADRVSTESNRWVETAIDNSVAIDVVPKGETVTKEHFKRITAEFDYTNAKTQKAFVIEFLGDAENEDKTNYCDYKFDNFMIEAGTADANAKDKLEVKPVDGGHMIYDSSAKYVDNTAIIAEYTNGVFTRMAKVKPNRGLYSGAAKGNTLKGFIWKDTNETLIPLTEATPEYENREFETYKTIDFAKSTYSGDGRNAGVNVIATGERIGYTASTNQFFFEQGAISNLLMQIAAGGDTGILLRNQLPEFTSEDIGKKCKISIKVLPYDGNVKGTVLTGYLGTSNVVNIFAKPTDYTEGDITVMETWVNSEYSVLNHEFIVTEELLSNRSVVMWFNNSTTAATLTYMIDDMVVQVEK